MRKIIIYNCEKVDGLVDPLCQGAPDVEKIKCNEIEKDGVIYRVWSTYENKTDVVKSLENLMLNRLETEEENDPEPEKTEEIEEQDSPTLKM